MLPNDKEFEHRVHERHMQVVRGKLINAMKVVILASVGLIVYQLVTGSFS